MSQGVGERGQGMVVVTIASWISWNLWCANIIYITAVIKQVK